MLSVTIGGIHCKISLLFPAVLLVLLYHDPSGVAVTGVFAALIHECGHIIAMLILSYRPNTIALSIYGAKIDTQTHPPSFHMLFIAAAGPLVNIAAAMIAFVCNGKAEFRIIHLSLAAINMIPVYPLDGGQMLYHLLQIPEWNHKRMAVYRLIEWISMMTLLSTGATVFFFTKYNFTLLLVALYVFFCKLFAK